MGFLGGGGEGSVSLHPLPGKVCLPVLRIQDGGDLLLRSPQEQQTNTGKQFGTC